MPAHIKEIPPFLAHLPLDERGYPIPYFVTMIDGKPDFRLLDVYKQEICIKHHKCGVCGRKLIKGVYYFVSGPLGAKNEVSTDPPMHKECAEWSLFACPHLRFEKARRRESYPAGTDVNNKSQLLDKPDIMFCTMADKFKAMPNPASPRYKLIKYHAVKIQGYVYQDGILTAVN